MESCNGPSNGGSAVGLLLWLISGPRPRRRMHCTKYEVRTRQSIDWSEGTNQATRSYCSRSGRQRGTSPSVAAGSSAPQKCFGFALPSVQGVANSLSDDPCRLLSSKAPRTVCSASRALRPVVNLRSEGGTQGNWPDLDGRQGSKCTIFSVKGKKGVKMVGIFFPSCANHFVHGYARFGLVGKCSCSNVNKSESFVAAKSFVVLLKSGPLAISNSSFWADPSPDSDRTSLPSGKVIPALWFNLRSEIWSRGQTPHTHTRTHIHLRTETGRPRGAKVERGTPDLPKLCPLYSEPQRVTLGKERREIIWF
ncbi:hypothetical protein BGZ63DRAFT_373923 [Mariannaea sp. PMI_226]|nr:hypothetical protein BGZ63DRAFT_373923 [Mariannaea sp. PMI_226]